MRMWRHRLGLMGVSLKIRACERGGTRYFSAVGRLSFLWLILVQRRSKAILQGSDVPPAARHSSPDAGKGSTHFLKMQQQKKTVTE